MIYRNCSYKFIDDIINDKNRNLNTTFFYINDNLKEYINDRGIINDMNGDTNFCWFDPGSFTIVNSEGGLYPQINAAIYIIDWSNDGL